MQPYKPKTDLKSRAHAIESWVEKHFIDPNGVVYTCLNKATGKPLDREFLIRLRAKEGIPVENAAPEALWSYEQCHVKLTWQRRSQGTATLHNIQIL